MHIIMLLRSKFKKKKKKKHNQEIFSNPKKIFMNDRKKKHRLLHRSVVNFIPSGAFFLKPAGKKNMKTIAKQEMIIE